VVPAWSVDRLGRSLHDLVVSLNDLHGKHTNLRIESSTPVESEVNTRRSRGSVRYSLPWSSVASTPSQFSTLQNPFMADCGIT
jgi:hypothetical protein